MPIIIITIFLVSLSLAQSTSTETNNLQNSVPNQTDSKTEIPKISLTDLTPKLDESIEKDIQLPESSNKIIRMLLGFNESEKITMNLMISIIVFMFIIFLILGDAFGLITSNRLIKWLGALGVTILLGMTKGIKETILFYFGITDSIKALGNWSTGALTFLIIILIIIFILIGKIEKRLRKEREIEQSNMDGIKIGTELGFLSKMRQYFFETKKD